MSVKHNKNSCNLKKDHTVESVHLTVSVSAESKVVEEEVKINSKTVVSDSTTFSKVN